MGPSGAAVRPNHFHPIVVIGGSALGEWTFRIWLSGLRLQHGGVLHRCDLDRFQVGQKLVEGEVLAIVQNPKI
ncbi:hypothetical protein VFPPC_17191 [Pochonia chlamydosporia 170]|uniref:Uncharacterized protein n=1 Tax=Pochonia chlamydosporia 170 TaxID=1380566 RepID=A0A179EW37_METCM|nr:hypothetical protein VFPPC_17191 [Pochonia chlamydosporia 170]OAQ57398.1 hypothetical protein VFPPC_17191 [Pochonia chlamydosporia 170]